MERERKGSLPGSVMVPLILVNARPEPLFTSVCDITSHSPETVFWVLELFCQSNKPEQTANKPSQLGQGESRQDSVSLTLLSFLVGVFQKAGGQAL